MTPRVQSATRRIRVVAALLIVGLAKPYSELVNQLVFGLGKIQVEERITNGPFRPTLPNWQHLRNRFRSLARCYVFYLWLVGFGHRFESFQNGVCGINSVNGGFLFFIE